MARRPSRGITRWGSCGPPDAEAQDPQRVIPRDGLRAMETVPRYHALGVLGLGVWWATMGRRPSWAVAAAAYIGGAEILWRMTGTGLFWEFGKYGAALILLLVFVRLPSHRTTYWGALLYIVLLIPSAL